MEIQSRNMKRFSKIERFLESELDPAFARRARIIFENLDLSGKERILEIGCGRGFYLRTLDQILPPLEITGIDLNERYLQTAKKFIDNPKVNLIKADATSLPFKNNTFNRIIASEILEHIPDDEKAISQMYRVLKPGGIAIVTVPNKNYPFFWDPLNWILERVFHCHIPSHIWWLAGIWAGHVRLYDKREIRESFRKEGFSIKGEWFATHYCFPFSHFLLYGIGKNLVEKGLFKNFNRFEDHSTEKSALVKILQWPFRQVDRFNKGKYNFNSNVNIIIKVVK